ncbi:MAG: large conductance mechanosensitive channel protein MscL [Niastella sp.]
MMKEFREFALKGNVVDLAIGVIIGAAFSSIVSSLVDDVITPLLLKPALEAANLQDLDKFVVFGTVKIGKFLSAVLKFLIVAFILFLIVKAINRFKKKEEAATAVTPEDIILLREIRDALKK